jgi:hypothetical protein
MLKGSPKVPKVLERLNKIALTRKTAKLCVIILDALCSYTKGVVSFSLRISGLPLRVFGLPK